jgi:uncharacterized protein YcfJ
MSKLNLMLAAAALAVAASTGAVAPADAQVSIRANEYGVGVRVGEPRVYTPGVTIYGQAECRTVTVRKKRPNGTVIVTKERVCD